VRLYRAGQEFSSNSRFTSLVYLRLTACLEAKLESDLKRATRCRGICPLPKVVVDTLQKNHVNPMGRATKSIARKSSERDVQAFGELDSLNHREVVHKQIC